MVTFAKSLKNDDAKTRNREYYLRSLSILDENAAFSVAVFCALFYHLYVLIDVCVSLLRIIRRNFKDTGFVLLRYKSICGKVF